MDKHGESRFQWNMQEMKSDNPPFKHACIFITFDSIALLLNIIYNLQTNNKINSTLLMISQPPVEYDFQMFLHKISLY